MESLAAAAIDGRAAALVLQVPAIGADLPPADPTGSVFNNFRQTALSGNIEPSQEEIQGPMPVVSDDPIRRPCALQPLTAYRWFIEYGSRLHSNWLNDVTRARPKAPAPWHPGVCAAYVRCPALFLVSPEDEMPGSVPAISRHAYEKIPGTKEWLDIPGGHFGLLYFPSVEFDRAASAQRDFLIRHLLK